MHLDRPPAELGQRARVPGFQTPKKDPLREELAEEQVGHMAEEDIHRDSVEALHRQVAGSVQEELHRRVADHKG